MGSQVIVSCNCGLNKEILIGGGMMSFHDTDYFPCFCAKCKDVVQGNLKELGSKKIIDLSHFEKDKIESHDNNNLVNSKVSCPKCYKDTIPYTDESLHGEIKDNLVVQWGNTYLYDGTYKCPKCENMTLEFSMGYLRWD